MTRMVGSVTTRTTHADSLATSTMRIGAVHPLLQLQRSAGNRAIAQSLQVQRCGSIPPDQCPCHQDENDDAEPVQRASAISGSPAILPTGLTVQRHPGFRAKPALETETLKTPELQTAATSAALALEVGKSEGDPVRRLQVALNQAGFPVAISSRFDAPTQRANAAFQSAHGIPFPTGRQAGPKTLSTLDDHVAGTAPPQPPANCSTYQPGERESSLTSPGRSVRTGGLGNELRLFDFAAGRGRMKVEHERSVAQFINDFGLFEPESAFEVDFIRGFTDTVDAEETNVILREARAIDVSFFLRTNGVPAAPDGQAAAEGSYDAGCDQATRTNARAVLIRLRRRKTEPPSPKPNPARRLGCGADTSARIDAALNAAIPDLTTAAGLLATRPLSQPARDALFVYFRAEDDRVAGAVSNRLATAANGLANRPVVDCAALVGCGEGTHAVTNLITGQIHVCNDGANDPDHANMERTLMHESMHLFAGMGALGERSHGPAPGCDESDVVGLGTSSRLGNADSYAALAIRLTKDAAGLRASAEHFHGGDLFVSTRPKKTGLVKLADGPDTFTAAVERVNDLAPTMQWRLTDSAGRHYLLLNTQDEVVDPSIATDATLVKIGRKTRDLLAARGVSDVVLSVHVLNSTGVNRTVSLPLALIP